MNKLSTSERVQIIAALVEGNSINSVCRMTGRSKHTVLKLLVDMGKACAKYHNAHVVNIAAERIQCDEIWAFVHSKQKNVKVEQMGMGYGDAWTWTAIDADTKLMISYMIGNRSPIDAQDFMDDVASRVTGRPQVTTDGFQGYLKAVINAFNGDVDHAVLQKIYASTGTGRVGYSPPACIGAVPTVRWGNPDRAHISTSYVERSNLTMRMRMRRYTRLTNGFSKKLENLCHAAALHFMHYNFCRVHQTLRVTPAMEAGLADHVWEVEELVALLG